MKRLLLGFLVAMLSAGIVLHKIPHAKVHAPTTRYHGYQLNHDAIQRAKVWTVLLSADDFGGSMRGTGVMIDSKHILTCYHVAAESKNGMVAYLYPGRINTPVKFIYGSEEKDLAILEIQDATIHSLKPPVFQAQHYDGEPITIIGNILGAMRWFVSYGIVSGENERDLYTDGLVLGGDSGGPWINEKGEVVALSDWTLMHGSSRYGISGGISAKTINTFLDGYYHPKNILQMLFGG